MSKTCWKCGGSGYLPQYEYFNHGVCYACGGTGQITETQEHKVSQSAFEKATKKGGDVKHLFDVNPKHLDRKQLEKFRTRIKTRATELGVKLKAGFTTDSALKKVWEAYAQGHPKTAEKMGNRFHTPVPVKKPDSNEPPKKSEPPKNEPPKQSAQPSNGGGTATSTATAEPPKKEPRTGTTTVAKPDVLPLPKLDENKRVAPEKHTYEDGKTENNGKIKFPDDSVKLTRLLLTQLRAYASQEGTKMTDPEFEAFIENLHKIAGFLGIKEEGHNSIRHIKKAIHEELDTIEKGGRTKSPTPKVAKATYDEVQSHLAEDWRQQTPDERGKYRGMMRKIASDYGVDISGLTIPEARKKIADDLGFDLPRIGGKEYTPKEIEDVLSIDTSFLEPDELDDLKKQVADMHDFVTKGNTRGISSFGGMRQNLKTYLDNYYNTKQPGQSDADMKRQKELHNWTTGQVRLTVKGGKAYTSEGIEIVNPLDNSNGSGVAYKFYGKKLGESTLPYLPTHEYATLSKKYGKDATLKAYKMLEEVIDMVNTSHKGLIANVGLSEFTTDSTELGVGGYYMGNSRKLAINVGYVAYILHDAENKSLTPGQKQTLENKLRKMKYETTVHELSHAFHQQAFANYSFEGFAKEQRGLSSKADRILDEYKKMFSNFPFPLNNEHFGQLVCRVMLGDMKFNQQQATLLQQAGFDVFDTPKFFAQMNAIFKAHVPREYALFNSKEFFAVLSQKFLTNPKGVEKHNPKYYQMLKELYEGVVDVETIQKTYDSRQWK